MSLPSDPYPLHEQMNDEMRNAEIIEELLQVEPTHEMDAVNSLRYKAFRTNAPVDVEAYRDAAVKQRQKSRKWRVDQLSASRTVTKPFLA